MQKSSVRSPKEPKSSKRIIFGGGGGGGGGGGQSVVVKRSRGEVVSQIKDEELVKRLIGSNKKRKEDLIKENNMVANTGLIHLKHPTLHTRETTKLDAVLGRTLCGLEISKINVINSEQLENLTRREDRPRSSTSSTVENRSIKEMEIKPIGEKDVGDNLLETQHWVDQCYENQCLKEMATTGYATAQKKMVQHLSEEKERFTTYVDQLNSVYTSFFDCYGNKLENMIKAIMPKEMKILEEGDIDVEKEEKEEEDDDGEEDRKKDKLFKVDTNMYMKMLQPNKIHTVERKDIVSEFLRPALTECGERPCVNGEHCASVLQFYQLWLKDPTLFKKSWNLKIDKTTGKILDSNNRPFEVFPLREFLTPDVEKFRKAKFHLAMANFLNTIKESDGKNEHGCKTSVHSELELKISSWLMETTQEINPTYTGYCILCLLKIISKLTTIYNSANIISNPNVCALIQHHKNIFGKPGEYKQGFEIQRGSNLCGLVGTVLEYRVDNYLPAMSTVHYKALEISQFSRNTGGFYNNRNRYGSEDSNLSICEKQVLVRQWVESESIVCKATDELNFPKSSL